MGRGFGRRQGTENPLTVFFFCCWGGWHYHTALSTDWDHKLSWAPPVFMTDEGGTGGVGTGLLPIMELAVFHSHSLSLPASQHFMFLPFPVLFITSLFLSTNLIPLSISSYLDFFLLIGILSSLFLWRSRPLHHTFCQTFLSLSFVTISTPFSTALQSHLGIYKQGWKVKQNVWSRNCYYLWKQIQFKCLT